VALISKVLVLALAFTLNFFLFFFSTTLNFFLSFCCSLVITSFVYMVMKSCIEVVRELNNRFTDYEALYLFTIRSLKSLGSRRNLLSLLIEAYKVLHVQSEAQQKMKRIIGDTLRKKILKVKKENLLSVTELSSPLTKLTFSLLEKLDSVDEASLRDFMTSLHDLSFSLYLNAKKLREVMTVEKLKYKILQMASSMTLGFVMKTLFMFTKFSSTNITLNVFVFTSFALLSITIFTVFACIIQLRYPSLKDLILCLTIFIAVTLAPPHVWV